MLAPYDSAYYTSEIGSFAGRPRALAEANFEQHRMKESARTLASAIRSFRF